MKYIDIVLADQNLLDELYERTEPAHEYVEISEDGTGRTVYRLVSESTWMVPTGK